MSRAIWLVVAVGLLVAPTVHAQTLLNQVEAQIKQGVPPAGAPGAPPSLPPVAAGETGFLGLVADDRQDNGQGIRVTDLMPGGPAERGGLKAQDVVTSINGNPTRSMDDFARAITGQGPGTPIKLQVQRAGQSVDVTVVLGRPPVAMPGSAPGTPPATEPRPLLGLRLATLTPEMQARFKVPAPVGQPVGGAVVVGVMQGSVADKAGIPLEAVIVSINSKPVLSSSDVTQIITDAGAGAEVVLAYYAGGELREKRVTLDTPNAPRAGAAPGGPPTAGAMPGAPPPPPGAGFAPTNDGRVEALERRLLELERRLRELENTVQSIPKPRDNN
ncbi:MAG: PDZ domain-containing protein [Planctomycetes bacterium]|nr:PDZ domain-containing protein [Planctomycetota bacterium]